MKEKKTVTNKFILFWEFLKIGLFTIGGGVVMLPLVEKIAVKEKQWITEEEMMECVTISQSVPGVIAITLATYIGKKKAGLLGALLAVLGVVVPSFFIIILFSIFAKSINNNQYLTGAFTAMKTCVTALVLVVVYNMSRKFIKTVWSLTLAVAGFAAVGIFGVNAIIIIVVAAVMGIIHVALENKKTLDENNNSLSEECNKQFVNSEEENNVKTSDNYSDKGGVL
ncbi:MAG: chromate transporter [Eubacteriales bacterium]|nr:chromate transporter [Eubacteriales bacterium]